MKKSCCLIFWLALALASIAETVTPSAEPVVYIAGFTDTSGSRRWENIETAVRDLLVSTVSTNKYVRIVDREHLNILLREQQLTLQGLADANSSARVGKLLGADRIITGNLLLQDENITIIAHIVDVPTAVIQATCREQGRTADLLDIVVALAGQISKNLAIPFDPGAITAIDLKPVCSLNFLRGLGFFYTGDYNRALMDFMISGDIDPDNHERHYWMGRCYLGLEEKEHARLELCQFLKNAPDDPLAQDARKLLDKLANKAEH